MINTEKMNDFVNEIYLKYVKHCDKNNIECIPENEFYKEMFNWSLFSIIKIIYNNDIGFANCYPIKDHLVGFICDGNGMNFKFATDDESKNVLSKQIEDVIKNNQKGLNDD